MIGRGSNEVRRDLSRAPSQPRCVVVCQDDVVIKTLHAALSPTFIVTFIVEKRSLARRLQGADISTVIGSPRRVDTFLKADVDPRTCVIVADTERRSIKPVLRTVTDAGGNLIYVLRISDHGQNRSNYFSTTFPEISTLDLSHLVQGSLLTSLGRAMTRARVQQYQRYFSDANRVLILLHNDPDPDALASGLALRALLHRTKTTAIIGAFQGTTRPENIRMADLLDITVSPINSASLVEFDRIALVDVQPDYFGKRLNRVDLVVDHHPERSEYAATFKDIRPECGSTATILTEHIRAVDVKLSERISTAMLYAIKSDTLFLSRHTDSLDLEAFTFLYPIANAALVRKMEGAAITIERLNYVANAIHFGHAQGHVLATHIGIAPREDLVTYIADYLLQLDTVRWSIVAGIVNENIIVSVRSLDYSKDSGNFVRKYFRTLGSAGGHRTMAKAVIPLTAFKKKFGDLEESEVSRVLADLSEQFLKEPFRSARPSKATNLEISKC